MMTKNCSIFPLSTLEDIQQEATKRGGGKSSVQDDLGICRNNTFSLSSGDTWQRHVGHTILINMSLEKDHQASPGSQSQRDTSCQMSFKVDSSLLDMMAEDDEARTRSAAEKLKETKKIILAERYLRIRFR